MLTTDADGRRAIHLVHDRENLMRILAVRIHEPSVERGEIRSVEEPDDFVWDNDRLTFLNQLNDRAAKILTPTVIRTEPARSCGSQGINSRQ
jgi:hypothetical protein